MHPIYIIDTSVISHHIVNRLDDCFTFQGKTDFDMARQYVKLAYHWMNNLGFLQIKPKKASVIWVMDSKPYWRTKFFEEYKGGRKSHSQQFMHGNDFLHSLAKPLGFNGYEADDVTALLHYVWKRRQNRGHMHLVTIDCDWCGFVDEEVTWMNTAHYFPRIRSTAEVKTWIQGKLNKDKSGRYKLKPDFKASDIWEFKVATGDSSDNLPPGCKPFLIDLMHPHPAYTLWNKREAVIAAGWKLDTTLEPRADTGALEQMMSRIGLVPPIAPFLPEAKVA